MIWTTGRVVLLLLLTLALPLAVAAQPGASIANAKAKVLYDKAYQYSKARDFNKALETLATLNQKYPSVGEGFLLRGNLLKALGDNRAALDAYREGLGKVALSAGYTPQYHLLGDLAMDYGQYQVAAEAYQRVLKVAPKTYKGVADVRQQLKNSEFAQEAMKNPQGETPVRLASPLNDFKFQYFPALTADNRFLLFTGRPSSNSDENLYVSRQTKEGKLSGPVPISPAINTPYNEGAGTISGDGKTLVFASCDRPGAIGNCDLYISRRTGNNWSVPQNLGANVNSTEWDSQPSLSADGRTLYFTSTRKGGQGQEDIYLSVLREDGTWGAAQNVGTPVNTPGKDMAPFIHASGTTLYYVTDGLTGMGGLDVFRSERTPTGDHWSVPRNLGYPLNTFENEASLFITSDNRQGFCSRTRVSEAQPAGGLKMRRERPVELFRFDVPPTVKAMETSTYAQGRVFDAVTKKPLRADVKIYDVATDALTQFVTSDSEEGDYTVVLNEGHQYAMYAVADKYLLKSISFDFSSRKDFDPQTLDIYLDPVRAGRSVVLNNLFFDTNKYELEPRSRTELNRLIEFMRQYQDVQIEVSGHTDNVGTTEANQVLSQRRAQAVVDYLATHGVSVNRLRSKGYGASRPLASNDTDENRHKNRRIELRIL